MTGTDDPAERAESSHERSESNDARTEPNDGRSESQHEQSDATPSITRRSLLRTGAAASALAVGVEPTSATDDVVVCECESMGEFLVFDDQFAVINNDWSASDAEQCVRLYDDGRYGWHWERDGEGSGPNYPEVSVGCRPWGDPTTTAEAFPVQRGDVEEFAVATDWTVTVTSGDEWNLALEWWLTEDEPADGLDVSDSMTHEVMVVMEWGSGHDHGAPIEAGAFTDAYGNEYDYWEHYEDHGDESWSFHIFRIAANDCPDDADLTAVMDYLDEHVEDDWEPIHDDLWVNGVEMGNEYWSYTAGETTVATHDVTVDGTTIHSGEGVDFECSFDVDDPADCDPSCDDSTSDDTSDDGDVVLAVDAGGDGYEVSDGTQYEADAYYEGGDTYSTEDPIADTDDDQLYQTERWGDPLAYDLPVEDGTYDVELQFAELYWESSGERVFDVTVEGEAVRTDFDIYDAVGDHTAVTVTATDVEASDGLSIECHASVDNAKLSAVRVLEVSDTDDGGDDGSGDDDDSLAEPSNLTVTDTSTDAVDLDWDAVDGADWYEVSVDGSHQHDTTATETTVDGLAADTSYEFGVTAVTDDGSKSETATETASTDAEADEDEDDTESTDGGLVVHDFDGDPPWPDENDLGEWCGAGSFENGGGDGDVVDEALRLEYDGGGWLQTYVERDVSEYDTLRIRIRGDDGGEEDQFSLELGDAGAVLSELTDEEITTSYGTVVVDLADNDLPTDLGDVYLDFWGGEYAAGAVEIDQLWFE